MTLKKFIKKWSINLMSADPVDENPWMHDPFPGAYHWEVRWRVRGQEICMSDGLYHVNPWYFSQGKALPDFEFEDFILSVVSDIQSLCPEPNPHGYEILSFKDWCKNFDYNDDSIKDHETYQIIVDMLGALEEPFKTGGPWNGLHNKSSFYYRNNVIDDLLKVENL